MKHCLVVDDSRTVRRIARGFIEEMSFSVSEASDGKDAIERCDSQMPDVILLDWNMPNMNGIEFLRTLRARERGKDPIVIFCTTENEVSFIVEAMEAGANEYIMKPFDKSILISKFTDVGLLGDIL